MGYHVADASKLKWEERPPAVEGQAPRRAADALALVHAQTGCRDFRVRFPKKRIITARLQNTQTGRIEREIPV